MHVSRIFSSLLAILTSTIAVHAEDDDYPTDFSKQRRVQSLAFDSESRTLAAVSWCRVGLWDVTTGQHKDWFQHLPRHPDNQVKSIVLVDDGRLLSAGSQSRIFLWDTARNKKIREIYEPWIVQYQPKSLMDPTTETGLGHLFGSGPYSSVGFESAAVCPDQKLVAAGLIDGTAHLWSLETGEHIREFGTSIAKKTRYQLGDVIQDKQHLDEWRTCLGKTNAAGDGFTKVDEYQVWEFPDSTRKNVHALAFTPDGKQLLTSCDGIHIWNVENGKQVRSIDDCSGFALSPDGGLLVAYNYHEVATWMFDTRTGDKLGTLARGRMAYDPYGFTANGKLLLTGGIDNQLRIWNMDTVRVVRTFPDAKSTQMLEIGAISPDGKYVAGYWRDVGIRLWNVETGEELFRQP